MYCPLILLGSSRYTLNFWCACSFWHLQSKYFRCIFCILEKVPAIFHVSCDIQSFCCQKMSLSYYSGLNATNCCFWTRCALCALRRYLDLDPDEAAPVERTKFYYRWFVWICGNEPIIQYLTEMELFLLIRLGTPLHNLGSISYKWNLSTWIHVTFLGIMDMFPFEKFTLNSGILEKRS